MIPGLRGIPCRCGWIDLSGQGCAANLITALSRRLAGRRLARLAQWLLESAADHRRIPTCVHGSPN